MISSAYLVLASNHFIKQKLNICTLARCGILLFVFDFQSSWLYAQNFWTEKACIFSSLCTPHLFVLPTSFPRTLHSFVLPGPTNIDYILMHMSSWLFPYPVLRIISSILRLLTLPFLIYLFFSSSVSCNSLWLTFSFTIIFIFIRSDLSSLPLSNLLWPIRWRSLAKTICSLASRCIPKCVQKTYPFSHLTSFRLSKKRFSSLLTESKDLLFFTKGSRAPFRKAVGVHSKPMRRLWT